jgi:putative transposase
MARKCYSPEYIITKRREAEVHLIQAKIERYRRSMKNVVLLCNYYYPWDLEQAIAAFLEYYNHQRYHEALYNLTPADVYFGREKGVLSRREQIKNKTLSERRIHYFNTMRVYNVQ